VRVHSLLHAPFEGLAAIEPWLVSRGHRITQTRFWLDEPTPQVEEMDWLIVMGGPMGVYEEDKYAWLKREKKFIEQAIHDGKLVLGVCLGSQLVAEVLGGRVYRNQWKEIGWHQVTPTEEGRTSDMFRNIGPEFHPFHWHGDTFDLPPGAIQLARSAACEQQAFSCGQNVLALQFHPDATRTSVELMLRHCSGDLLEGPYVQSREEILAGLTRIEPLSAFLSDLLLKFSATTPPVSVR
jgi:GMP synthase (glutamine-hydrolysing)